MAEKLSMALAELLRKADAEPDLDTLREGVRVLTQALMELEVAQHLGAERYQRSPERQGERNGYRERSWDTRVGTLELKVPRVRDGSFFPGLLEPRKRAERALVATVREAYVQGVSTRRVDDLVKALGLEGISKSQVSRLCEELDTEVERFRSRKLEGAYPYIWLDATFLKVRQEHRVVNRAVVIAVGLNAATGQREVLGVDVGPREAGAFWLRFLRGLVARGLSGVQLVISDSHQGLKGAIAAVLQGASWQRCRTHFMRNVLGLVPKGTQQMVAATIRTVFVQPDAASAHEQWRRVAGQLRPRFPRVAQLLDVNGNVPCMSIRTAAWVKGEKPTSSVSRGGGPGRDPRCGRGLGDQGSTSSPSRSASRSGASHSSQRPPSPMAQQKTWQSGQRRSPTRRSPQLPHS